MTVKLDLHYVDELIAVREEQHGGQPGAPIMVNGYREGQSINRSCIVMLSALLQVYVEEVFIACSVEALPKLENAEAKEQYRLTFRHWGNPSAENVQRLFSRLAIGDVLEDLRWQKCTPRIVRNKLDDLNTIRNSIAHGVKDITVRNRPLSLTLARVKAYRSFVLTFSGHFETHAKAML